jgi:hypothetical protein
MSQKTAATDTSWLGHLSVDHQIDLAEAALAYHQHGWHPVLLWSAQPDGSCSCSEGAHCRRAGKHPLESEWQRPKTEEELRRKLTKHRSFGLGVLTGYGFWVLDVDGAEGFATLLSLEKEHGKLPPTLTVGTGSGGLHLYFLQPEGCDLPNKTRFAPGIDTRALGGLVVVPPRATRRARSNGFSLLAPMAQPPLWLPERVSRRRDGTSAPRPAPRRPAGRPARTRPGGPRERSACRSPASPCSRVPRHPAAQRGRAGRRRRLVGRGARGRARLRPRGHRRRPAAA